MSSRSRLGLLFGLAASGATAALLFTRRHRAPSPAAGREAFAAIPPADRHRAQLAAVQPGSPGSGGYYGTWENGSPNAAIAEHIEFQYADMEHQSETALSGMWLFLATEVLFFGGLFLLYMVYRAQFPHAFALASQHAEVMIGTCNTLLLLTTSAVFAWGLGQVRAGHNQRLFGACVIVAILGLVFLGLKAWEWKGDLDKHLFPGPGFAITGQENGGAQLFWLFYWVATALHGAHMIVGIGLVAWIGWRARQEHYSPGYFTPPEAVGLYWSFVDMVWLCLYPLIYLAGGVGS